MAASLAFLLAPERSIAADLQQMEATKTRLAAGIAPRQRQVQRIGKQVVTARRNYEKAKETFVARLVAIYRTGGITPLQSLAEGDSVRDVVVTAEAIEAVASQDSEVVEDFARAKDRIPALQKRARALREQIRERIAGVRSLERKIAAEKRRLAEARLAAIRARRAVQSPLAAPQVVPTPVETVNTAGATEVSVPEAPTQPTGYTESGIASFYADSFAGEATASGEPYDPAAMTAAHKTLPLGTWVLVSAPAGSVLVRINDRGPFVAGRIIDLSAAAAAAAGIDGIAPVTITVQ